MAQLKNTIVNDTGFLQLPVGTTAQRPTPSDGHFRYNTQLGYVEEYRDGSWSQISHRILEGSAFAQGKILQVVYGTTTSLVSTNSTSFQNSTLSATITPQFASSIIVVQATQIIRSTANMTSSRTAETRLRRTRDGSTSTLGTHQFWHRARGSNSSERWEHTDNWSYRETASVVTPITYFTQLRRVTRDTIQAQRLNNSNSRSTITLMEIAQ